MLGSSYPAYACTSHQSIRRRFRRLLTIPTNRYESPLLLSFSCIFFSKKSIYYVSPLESAAEGLGTTPQATGKRKNDDDILDVMDEMECNHNRRQEEEIKSEEKYERSTQSTYLQNKVKKLIFDFSAPSSLRRGR